MKYILKPSNTVFQSGPYKFLKNILREGMEHFHNQKNFIRFLLFFDPS